MNSKTIIRDSKTRKKAVFINFLIFFPNKYTKSENKAEEKSQKFDFFFKYLF